MKYNTKIVHCSEYMPMYNKLSMKNKALAASIAGFKSCSYINKSKYMTRHYFNKFTDFYNHVSKEKLSNNTVGLPVEFDNQQKKHYLTELTNWINSEEYSLASMSLRHRIIAEQRRISNQLKNNQ